MKFHFNLLSVSVTALALASCTSTSLTKTSKTADVGAQLQSTTVADLKVGERVTETMQVTREVARGGMDNIKHTVEANALAKAGNADVLLEPRYTVTKERKFLSSKVTSITVTGLPAKYTNFRSLPDSVWANPVFRNYKSRGFFAMPAKAASKSSKPFKLPKGERGEKQWRKPGFAGHFAITGGLSRCNESYGDYGDGLDTGKYTSGDFGLLVDIGWQMSNSLYVGLGSGVIFGENWDQFNDRYDDYEKDWGHFNRVPFYLNARYHFAGNAKKSAFADVKIGITGCPKYSYDPGFFFSPTIGYSFGAFDIGLSYIRSNLNRDYEVYDETHTFNKHYNNVHLSLGFTF